MKIYLDDPVKDDNGEDVKIEGTPLGYTPEGARYLLSHYESIAEWAEVGQQYTETALQHLHFVIYRLKKCIAYYEKLLPGPDGKGH